MAHGKMKTLHGLYKRLGRDAFLEAAKHYSNHVHDTVSQAISNYCAEIDGEKSLDVLCNRMYKIISAEADCHSNRMATLLFKIAVELAILNHTIGAGYVNLTDSEMRYIRNKALTDVRKSHGFISFEKAMEEERQKGLVD